MKRACQICTVLVLLLAAVIAVTQTVADERHKPQPLAGHVSTFSLQIDGPYKNFDAILNDEKKLSINKGDPFALRLTVSNNADDSIAVPAFDEDTATVWDIRDSEGQSAFTERCASPKKSPRPRVLSLPVPHFLDKGERNNGYALAFGNPNKSCFETDVLGTYTFQLHVPDPYTGTIVDSNKLTIKVTE